MPDMCNILQYIGLGLVVVPLESINRHQRVIGCRSQTEDYALDHYGTIESLATLKNYCPAPIPD